jgi:Domain of unknown function (DUF4258)
MDIPRLRYSRHARERMEHYHISGDEVEAVVWYPTRRDVTPSAVEHYGFVDDGRSIKVVTNRAETFVFTITDEHRQKTIAARKSVATTSNADANETSHSSHR